MVRKNLNLFDFLKVIYKFDLFEKSFSNLELSIFGFIMLFLVSVINVLINKYSLNGFSMETSFFYSFIGFPIVVFFIFLLFFIFVKSYDERLNGKKFGTSLLVFFSVSMYFYVIEYLLVFLREIFVSSSFLFFIISITVFLFAIYYLYSIVRILMNYFKTSSYRVISSLIFTYLTVLTFALLDYLAYLIGNLK